MLGPLPVAFFFGTMILQSWRRHCSHLQPAEMQKANSCLSVFPAVWCCECPGEGARLQGWAFWLHPVASTEVLPPVYPWDAVLGLGGPGFLLCVLIQASLQMGHLQRDMVLPESRIVFCQGDTVYIFLLVLYLLCWNLRLFNLCLYLITFIFNAVHLISFYI